ncbi:MAG: D-alanyl-D-alanine carboxypeptidase [Clostridia bacterium]|nr:D-alanyl-D-alanine carboxypeptidase [Clostridia bacterium]
MKKLLCIFLIWGIFAQLCCAISAESYALYDVFKGEFIAGENIDKHMLFASTTKIMTALVALELYDVEEIVKIKREWTGVEGSSMYLKPDEEVSVKALLYGLLMASGNDAAVALASLHTGHQEDFVTLMNARAIGIGAQSTFFENPNGLDGKNHLTTAHDLALITAEAMKNETFRQIVATTAIEIEGRFFSNHNKLLKMDDSIIGVKTGYTRKAGRCLVSCADKGGRQYIAVTLKAPDDWDDHLSLYEKYAKTAEIAQAVDENFRINIPVVGKKQRAVSVISEKTVSLPIIEGETVKTVVFGPRFIYNTAVKGEKYGEMHIYVDDKLIEKANLIYAQDVENTPTKRNIFNIWEILKSFRK